MCDPWLVLKRRPFTVFARDVEDSIASDIYTVYKDELLSGALAKELLSGSLVNKQCFFTCDPNHTSPYCNSSNIRYNCFSQINYYLQK
jgi:hypothetical protein